MFFFLVLLALWPSRRPARKIQTAYETVAYLNFSSSAAASVLPESRAPASKVQSDENPPKPALSGSGTKPLDLKRAYLSQIINRVARYKRYPRLEKERSKQGDVLLAFVVLKNGQIRQLRLLKGSGETGFDQEGLSCVKRALPFPQIPSDLKQAELPLQIRLKFRLNDS